MSQTDHFFFDRYGLAETDLERYLSAALSEGGNYADLYFEHTTTTSILVDESLVKTASEGISAGCGIRVVAGAQTGYAYSDDLSPDRILKAARIAARIASGPAQVSTVGLSTLESTHNFYPVVHAPTEEGLEPKLDLVRRADAAARAYDARIGQVRVGYADQIRHVLIAGSDGRMVADFQPLVRLNVFTLAQEGTNRQSGSSGGGGRVGLEFFAGDRSPESFAQEAARQAIVQLSAQEAPAGEMEVVLGPGWPGILLHEAVGHGLEADFNRKGISAFSGRIGQRVASEICTVVDDGTIPDRRGSLNVDDEGVPTQQNVLIENGVLKGYLQDKLSAGLMKTSLTGNGRRESYEHIPMPRMTNTYMLAGKDDPADIIRSVKHGLYAVYFGGGQVDITSGKFVFSASEAYLIEDGKVTAPVKGATLIGDGPSVLTRVTAVGYDLKLDTGIGTCGKEGQSVPVGVGIPTLKVDRLTVGGTAPKAATSFV
ncbi:MAG TPA: metalloprotease TldD [Terriglobia bacterium]|jgi:TldD protein|nr:metalloprotease TldD [Terriglobia bacterium]